MFAAPGLKSRALHAGYSLLVVILACSAVVYNSTFVDKLQEARSESRRLEERLRLYESPAIEARKLLDSRGYASTSDVGENRGFILAGLAFLKKNRELFPEMYAIAKKLALEGVRITESAGSVGSQGYFDEQKRMSDGAAAMASILRGLAK
jgi:hypothetical protein